MNDISRNTRTLILSFVIAVMALIPMRFVEIGQEIGQEPYVSVLGAEDYGEVVLPNAEVEVESADAVLEAPFNEIENQMLTGEVAGESCIARVDAESLLNQMRETVATGELQADELDEMIRQMIQVENSVCQ